MIVTQNWICPKQMDKIIYIVEESLSMALSLEN